ncbi:MAG: metallophosphoesterase [Betaproteobacteria bacterium]|nr:metallophosphoesterase [Betaproteobacteria bacterium]
MKIALLSDIHSNLPALQACADHAHEQGADAFAVLGDLVGYGPYPNEVVEWCRNQQQAGAIVIRGNHDRRFRLADAAIRPDTSPSDQAIAADWTTGQLDEETWAWLESLPLTDIRGGVFHVHGTAENPQAWHYASDPTLATLSLEAARRNPGVNFVVCGHVHQQALFYEGKSGQSLMQFSPTPGIPIPVASHRHWLATVGSVGQPRDGDPRASYALLDTDRATLCFHRVAYDIEETTQRIHSAGLPAALALRLERGL